MRIFKVFFVGIGSIIALLGVIMFVLGAADVPGTVFTYKSINYFGTYTWSFVEIDVFRYVKSLETSLSLGQFTNLTVNIPELPTTPNNNDILGWLNYVAKILAVFIPNIMIMLLNIIMIPMKLFLYPARVLTALIGVDTSEDGFLQLVKEIYRFNIPFIIYW